MGEGDPPTEEQVVEMRTRISDYMAENGNCERRKESKGLIASNDAFLFLVPAVFDARDVSRFLSEDFLVHRYFMHVYDLSGDQMENAITMVINSFKWRLETGIADIAESELNENLKNKGVLYLRNRDRDRKRMLVFAVHKHHKGDASMDEMKKYFLYFVERVERQVWPIN